MKTVHLLIGSFLLCIPFQYASANVKLHEIMIDPPGIDTGKEWISIKNTGTGSIALSEWILDPNNLPDVHFPPDTILYPDEILTVYFRSSEPSSPNAIHLGDNFSTQNISNNSGFIALYSSPTKNSSTLIDYVGYGAPNQSFVSHAIAKELWQGEWFLSNNEGFLLRRVSPLHHPEAWVSEMYLPESENQGKEPTTGSGTTVVDTPPTSSGSIVVEEFPNQNPIPVITIQGNKSDTGYAPFSFNVTGEESYDPDKDTLTYFWDFGNGETSTRSNPLATTYSTPGVYTVLLTVTDTKGAQTSTSLQVTVNEKATQVPSTSPTQTSTHSPICTTQTSIGPIISELFPNPDGDDKDKEWIELFNPHQTPISLCNWSIADTEGAVQHYFLPDIQIAPKGFYIIESKTSRISLNNNKETVILYTPSEEISDQVSYTNAPSGKSYSRILP